uniref:SFRICE_037759 n=1 Tax=Spodoptera frugiperda TaxID=7108 RepID=A0A2H1WV36_SPOFR
MDEVIHTNNYQKYIIKDGTVDICWAWHSPGESIRHIISDCGRLANSEYLHRHNQVAKIIHQQLALHYRLVEFEVPNYKYVPDPDRSTITDRTIVANKPDIVVINRLARRTVIIDIAIPHDENLEKVEKDKQIKYLDLAYRVVDMRLALCERIKSLIQKAVLLDTARIVRRFLSLEP